MYSTLVLALLAILPVWAVVAPVARRGTSIPIVRRGCRTNTFDHLNLTALDDHVSSVKAKIHHGFHNFEKNTGTEHPFALTNQVEKRGVLEKLGGDYYTLWYALIAVGNSPTYLNVLVDTGSSDLFIPASFCDSTCSGHQLWDPTSSSTAHDLGQSFSLWYSGGSAVSGELYTDEVTLATYSASSQTLGAVKTYSDAFQSYSFTPDGVMGMAFQQLSAYGASPLFQSLVSQGSLPEPVFSLKLGSDAELYVGGTNPDHYTGDISYTPVTNTAFWQVNMDVQVNGQTILSSVAAFVDTGSANIIAPPSQLATLYSAIGASVVSWATDYYTMPCNAFPTIAFVFGGTAFPIDPSVLNWGPVESGSSDCAINIVGRNAGTSMWVVGNAFLEGVYTTFDAGNMRVGFAQLA